MGLTWWSRLAPVARTASRTTAEANPIWGGVYASKGGVHVSRPKIAPRMSGQIVRVSPGARCPGLKPRT